MRHPAEVRRRIGYVPQLVSTDGTLTGYENMLLSARLYDIPRAERRERIYQALAAALREPEMRTKLADVNLRVVGSSPAEFATFLANEITKFAAVVKAANIKAE